MIPNMFKASGTGGNGSGEELIGHIWRERSLKSFESNEKPRMSSVGMKENRFLS